ncbi:N-acetyltransferase B complex (NatB) non catalytic subunit [Geosmithia morbida]|uniref:N-acetyltransferase B complex (NatB) non catalytic subunit n=1 Tax=Geosmithia morbida TaxID=1094350 RepID=A0A9P5D9Y5_9HYPO|nr:N-acetyltransferase B complex (NatB) non catalytic subunit [Geosmithia morbida]KAF4127009.1 N-acetyltransferase B complex (NatB) non catalytic subunit [Geosmithia morbida]
MHRQRPQLKNGVDLQLQSAFSDGNWPSVIRLAEKRARSLNDSYYEVVKKCAESQLDDPAAKYAAVAAVSQYIRDGTVVKDVDALDLLEWATLDLTDEDDYPNTLGPLRVKAVKASPKDRHIASRCLESCLIHWDLVSAQQIAAVLDRSFPQERHFMFWNIAITHLLSTSSQVPPEKQKLYGTLALRQMERAARAPEEGASEKEKARRVRTEEETLLLYNITERHGTDEDFKKLVENSEFSPLATFRQGRKELLLCVIARYRRQDDWDAIYTLCKSCLSDKDDQARPNLLASDYGIWEEFIVAARHTMGSNKGVVTEVHDLLLELVKFPGLRAIYRRNLLLARVSAAFQLLTPDGDDSIDGRASSTRLQELMRYVEDQAASPACFDDVKTFVEKLDLSGLRYFVDDFLAGLGERKEKLSAGQAGLLALKFRYLTATCPISYTTVPGEKPRAKCQRCGAEEQYASCASCFRGIWDEALVLYKDIATKAPDQLLSDAHVPPELALLLAVCSVRLAFPDPKATPAASTYTSAESLWHLYHAVLVLEYQLSFSPKNAPILLVLVQLHLRLGSAPRSRQLWGELGVKRTIMDSLGPLFYDRLSTVAPALLSPSDTWGWQLMDMLTSHYSYSLKMRMPRRLIDAFEAESYGSVLDMPRYIHDLRTSATRAMSLVEETRSERMLGRPTWELFSDPRFVEVNDDTVLKETLDYGSFPRWESSECVPVYVRLRLGPPPSNRRAHLEIMSEAFHDVLGYKAPQMYKTPLATSESDHVFVVETLTRIGNSYNQFLGGPEGDLTAAEAVYHDMVGLLSTLAPLCAASGSGRAAGLDAFCELTESIGAGLESLRDMIPAGSSDDVEGAVALLGSLHTVGVYRDAAKAVSLAAQWIMGVNQRAKERDRSGQSNLPKEVVARTKSLQSAAEEALKQGKGWMDRLRTTVKSGDFKGRLSSWLFKDAEAIRDVAYEEVVPGLVGNIGENVNGWQEVHWE